MNRHDVFQMGYISILMAIISLLSYDWLLSMGADHITASTMMVNIMVISKIFYLFSVRTSKAAFSKNSFTNPKAFVIIGVMIILQLILTYVPFMQTAFYTEPLTLFEWGVSILCGLLILIVPELDKGIRAFRKRHKN